MTPITQPLSATPTANPAPCRAEAHRLLQFWVDLARRAAAAAAHGSGEEAALVALQAKVEEALTDRSLITNEQLDEMVVWESGLIHHSAGTPPETCLLCRQAQAGSPPGIPAPAALGGRL